MVKKTILSYKTKSIARKSKVVRSSMAYVQAETVGIVFTIEDMDKHEKIKTFIKQLEDDDKQVEVLAYLPKNKDNHEFLFNFFTPKDISFWGTFTSEVVNSFVSKAFDYLFYIDLEINPLITNILAISKAKCRVGKFNTETEPHCEMMIQTENTIESLVKEMYRYTKILS